MAQLTDPRGLRLKSETKAADEADDPWRGDKTTAHFAATAPRSESARTAQPAAATLRLPPPSAAKGWEPSPRAATLEQRANVALESFWSEQTATRRTQIMARAFDPPWMRVLAAAIGIAMCVVFGWVLVAGPQLPSFMPQTQTLSPDDTSATAHARLLKILTLHALPRETSERTELLAP